MELLNLNSFVYKKLLTQWTEKEVLLWKKVQEAAQMSYSPYSNFKVGCVIELYSKTFIEGANQENASFPACSCAEAVALAKTNILNIKDPIFSLSIYSPNSPSIPVSPCGICRQTILEYEKRQNQQIQFYLFSKDFLYFFEGIENILPLSFSKF